MGLLDLLTGKRRGARPGGLLGGRMHKRSSTEGIQWVPVEGPDGGQFWASNDFLRDGSGNYIRGSAETANQLAQRFGARLPQSPAEVDLIGRAATRQLPFLASGDFAGAYPSGSNFDELTRLHNEAIAQAGYAQPTDDLAAGHFKTVMADGGIYLPGVQSHNVAHGPNYADYSQGIRLVRDTPPEAYPPPQAAPAVQQNSGGIAGDIRSGLVSRFGGLDGIDARTAETLADAFILNFEDESGLRPDVVEAVPNVHGTRGKGLYQLTGPRREAFEAQYGGDYSIDRQLDWLMYELQGPESRAWQNILTAAQSGDVGGTASSIVSDFLRPARQHRDRRIAEYTGGRMPRLAGAPVEVAQASTGGTDVTPRAPALTPTVSARNPAQGLLTPAQAPQEGRGGLLGNFLTRERRDMLALALEGMTLNPNVGLINALGGRIEDQREGERTEEQRAQDRERFERTVAWVESRDPELAAAMRANPQAENAIMGMVLERMQPQEPDTSAAEEAIQRMESIGVPRDVAIRIQDGVFTTSRDPVTNEVVVFDVANRAVVMRIDQSGNVVSGEQPGAPAGPTGQPAPASPDASSPELSFGSDVQPTNAENAFGLRGMLGGTANAVADFFGADPVAPEIAENQRFFRVLEEDLLVDLSQAYGRQPAAQLMERLRRLAPNVGTTEGSNAAIGELQALRDRFAADLASADRQASRRLSPEDRTAAENRIAAITSALTRIDQALSRFSSVNPQGAGQNRTQSGVTWSVVE